MNSQKMLLSLTPWLLFSVMVHRVGAQAAGVAALVAAALAVALLVRDSQHSRVKIIDVAGVLTFLGLAAVCFTGGSARTDWVADYGRGSAAAVLAVVMLVSSVTVPFTAQYARDSVPSSYWRTREFRSVNRRISAAWGGLVLVMAVGHLLAGKLDPATAPVAGSRPIDLILNWLLPIGLIIVGTSYTKSAAAGPQAQGASYRESVEQ